MRRRHDTGKGDCIIAAIGQPPRSKVGLGHCRSIEKRQPMQIGQGVGNVVIRRIDKRIPYMTYPSTRDKFAPSHGDMAGASLTQHDLDAEPDGTHQAGGDDRDHSLEGIALRLFHALSPAPQMLEVGSELFPVIVFDPVRGQD